jgi:hypothetical protein
MMSLSVPVRVGDELLGAAVRQERGYRFIATSLRAADMDQSSWSSLDALQAAADQLIKTGRIANFTPNAVEE